MKRGKKEEQRKEERKGEGKGGGRKGREPVEEGLAQSKDDYRNDLKELTSLRPGGIVASSLSIHRASRWRSTRSLSPPLGSRGSTSSAKNLTARGLYLWYKPM